MINLGQSWASIRPKILKAVLDTEVLESSVCTICIRAQACVRCHNCGLKNVLCVTCDEEVHNKKPLHDREIFHEGFFKPVAPTVSLDSNGNLITSCMCFLMYIFYVIFLQNKLQLFCSPNWSRVPAYSELMNLFLQI